ncbi:MAG: LamG domain-containing protein [Candidatus Pacebacteria bacterium]|nr:LamG domain-containing protein [Candidatus Paceibacterota bacterium]MDD5012882.1 LamG domain-containing protein [Candidatus Paceibacterota bacterium]MDD5752467.1 LamG domain-containing protein [Candidatus Paceibacterota bacterium]
MINKKIESFTLIEILVVIVIVGILSSFIIVGMSSLSSKADTARVQVWANGLRNSGLISIVSEWKFEGTTDAGDPALADPDLLDSWGSNNGATTAGPTVVASSSCALGKCLSFNGTTQFITVADNSSLALGTKMSAFIWIKGSTQTNDRGVFGQWNTTATNYYKTWMIATTTTGFNVQLGNSTGAGAAKTYTSTETVFDNKWHYVGFTYNVNTLNLYVDGLNISPTPTLDGAMTSLNDSDNRPISLGAYTTTGSNTIANGFNGYIDDAIIFNEAVTVFEVQRQYFSGLNNLLAKGEITNDEYNERVSLLNDSLGSK